MTTSQTVEVPTYSTAHMAHNSSAVNISWMSNGSMLENTTLGLQEESATGANIASPIVMFLAGLVGNVLALFILHRTRTEIRSMMFYTLVAALTWNDLIGICLTSPVTLAAYINGREMPAGDRLCRFNGFVMVCFGLSTPLIVCTMAIERSLALKCTYFYSKYCTPSSARIVVVALWAFVLLFGALPLFGVGSYSLQYPRTWCFLDFHTSVVLDMVYGYVYAILNLVIVVLMTFCNLVVMATLCQVRDTRRKWSSASLNSTLLYTDAVEEKLRPPQYTRRRQQRDVELQMIWLVCAITTIFAVCWVPLMVHIVLTLSVHNQSPVFGLVAVRLASLNQTLNPWLYVILRKTILTRIRDACCRCFRDDDLDHLRQFRPKNYSPRLHRVPQTKRQNYVHVRHQLCPSSQYVGNHNDLAEGSLGKGSKSGSKSGSRSRSLSGSRMCSLSGSDIRSGACNDSLGLCSVCRGKMKDVKYSWEGGGSSSCRSPCHTSCCASRACYASDKLPRSPPCPQNSVISSDNLNNPQDPPDGIYVDLFRHIPDPSSPSDGRDGSPSATADGEPPRPSEQIREASPLQDNSLSEADDHGYVSKVSTDSSRLSTPEAFRQSSKKHVPAQETSDVFDDGCGTKGKESSSEATKNGGRAGESVEKGRGGEGGGGRRGEDRKSRSSSSTVTGCAMCKDSTSSGEQDRGTASRKHSESSGC